MKTNIYYFTALILLLSSCRSIEKMVDQGNYREALEYGANKLAGSKSPKTNHVVAFEEAYAKLTSHELRRIENLMIKGGRNWITVYDLYEDIEYYQNIARRIDPLISRDGYKAAFNYINVSVEKKHAAQMSAEYYLEQAERYFSDARNGDKNSARRAYNLLSEINFYIYNYNDHQTYIEEMYDLGVETIGVDLIYSGQLYNPNFALSTININTLNTKWRKLESIKTEKVYDKILVVDLQNIFISSEKEWTDFRTYKKRVKDGFDYELDPKGNIAVDDKGKKIKKQRYKNVTADVTEFYREKNGEFNVLVTVYDSHENYTPLASSPLNTSLNFASCSINVTGDKRAVGNIDWAKFDNRLLSFPKDYEMIREMGDAISLLLRNRIDTLLRQTV